MNGFPKDYIILGVDYLKDNKEAFKSILYELIGSNVVNRKVLGCKVRCLVLEETKEKFKDLFKTGLSDMTKFLGAKHAIDTGISQPVVGRNIAIPVAWEREIEQEIEKLLKVGIIRESESSWDSGIIPVRKKTGELIICIDFRELNKITRKNAYPLPLIDGILDELAEARIFSTPNATSGYYQIEIAE